MQQPRQIALYPMVSEGVEYYNELGYVPYDVKINENAARTLEYAYADFTIAQMAEKLGKKDIAEKFYKQSLNYKNLFDASTNLMRGKNEDGNFQTPFNPLKWGDAFTEGNSLHYTWSVFHDVEGLIKLMGGNEAFEKQLDEVFTMPPDFDDSYYGFTIHEIREMQIVNMGNYAHGNQPIQHMIYLYNYAGVSPLFEKATISLENGNTFVINASNNSDDNIYINTANLNGKSYDKNYLDYETLQKGGELNFSMQDKPNKNWASSENAVPYSLSNN